MLGSELLKLNFFFVRICYGFMVALGGVVVMRG